MRELRYTQAIQEAIKDEMIRDEKVFVIGEDVRGGCYEPTRGLVNQFGPDRVIDTPLAETGILGAGLGSAMAGYRPIIDLIFSDFMYIAGDEIFLKAAQWHFIHGGKVNLPMVINAAVGGGLKLCNEHSHIPSALVLKHPGLKLVLPSTPYDAKGLMRTAIRDENPVCFFWHKILMNDIGPVPEEEYTIPFGVADVKREGTDITVVANSMMVKICLHIAQELEEKISIEVIDPRTLEPFDLEAVLKSVEKTGRLVIVDEDTERCGFAGELGFQVMDKAFELLDAPIKRVCAANYPIPGGFMEEHVLPGPAKIKAAIEAVMAE